MGSIQYHNSLLKPLHSNMPMTCSDFGMSCSGPGSWVKLWEKEHMRSQTLKDASLRHTDVHMHN
jgi:hypothetical protein